MTADAREGDVMAAVWEIDRLDVVREETHVLRVLDQ
jgi:hypothetical protein